MNASFIYSLKAPLNQWLKLQAKAIPICTHAVLAKRVSDTRYQLLAQWPLANAALDDVTGHAITEGVTKARLHLVQVDSATIIVCQPVSVDGAFWGTAVFRIACPDKKVMPSVMKKLQGGLTWLQLILQSYAAAPAPIQSSVQALTESSIPSTAKPAPQFVPLQESQLLQLVKQLTQEKSLRESAITLVNVLATQLKAVRVSIGLLQQQTVELEAISFSANFDKRTQPMQLIVQAMNEAVEQKQDIAYSDSALAETSGNAPTDSPTNLQTDSSTNAITRCHQQISIENNLTFVKTYLLELDEKIIGAITVERSDAGKLTPQQELFVTQVQVIAAQVMQLKISAEFGVLQRAKMQGTYWLNRRLGENNVVRRLLSVAAIVFFLALLIPVNYQISGEASIQGASKNILVSPQDGYLGSIKARPGDSVKKGDLLAQLNDDDLHVERRKVSSQLQQYQQGYDNALANSNRVEAAIANAQIDQAAAQLQLIDQELSRTQLLAPADGIVVSDDISQSLGAPVKQGQVLFEIAAATGFLVQIFVDERDIAAIQPGQVGQLKLTSMPNEILMFTVKSVTPISQVQEGRNYFRVEATLTSESDIFRPGMTGTAKIATGKHLLGWIWFHDIWHWFRLTLWW